MKETKCKNGWYECRKLHDEIAGVLLLQAIAKHSDKDTISEIRKILRASIERNPELRPTIGGQQIPESLCKCQQVRNGQRCMSTDGTVWTDLVGYICQKHMTEIQDSVSRD